MKTLLLSLSLSAMLWLTGCAIQQDIAILQNRVDSLERQNQELQRQNSKLGKQIQGELANFGESSQSAEKNIRTQYAGMNVTLDTMQQDLRLLTGRLEEVEFLVNRKLGDTEASGKKSQDRLDEVNLSVADLDRRMKQVEQYLEAEHKTSGSAPAKPTKGAGSQTESAAKLYDEAKEAYDKGQWDKARQQFQQLIKNYPNSENADNAQFWIGESYFNEQWYEKAILEYQTVIEKYPKGNKVPGAMLKQGLSFLKLGDKSNARIILKELGKKYPQSNEAAIAASKLKEF